MRLTKSKFISGWQCLKRLYLEVHQPEPAGEPDEQTVATFEQGHEVGRWAQKRFPGGLLIDAGHDEMSKALNQTARAMTDEHCPAIFEATFTHENVLARVDILERLPADRWRLIEVKSSTGIKDYHRYDLAIQRHILEGLGMSVVPCLMHLNRAYVYDGRQYDLEKLFVVQDLTAETAAIALEVENLLQEEWKVLAGPSPPDIAPGDQCTHPFECSFFDYCNKPLPLDHVRHLPGITAKKLAELAVRGITSIMRIPTDFPLTRKQQNACECVSTGKAWFGRGIRDDLSDLQFPLYFMDFETLAAALPRYAGMSPYDQIPYQWSVHAQRKPEGELEHYEFLAEDSADPRPEFIKTLCAAIGNEGSILVYSSAFESGRLGELARRLPEYRKEIENIRGRLWDLLPMIRAHVYHPEFRGSYSLKRVLPALVPEMTYEGMEVAEGSEAGLAWEKMLRAETGSSERNHLRSALLAYCEQDTLAMVRLLEVLRAAGRDANTQTP